MAGKHNRKEVDAHVDLHGMTAEQLRMELQRRWPEWHTLQCVRIVHGQGTVLKPELERWCAETGVPFLPDSHNDGALRIFPQRRVVPDNSIGTTLREKGLRLTPEQDAALRSPEFAEIARRQERQRQMAQEQRNRTAEMARAAQQRRDDMLWQAEMSRLGVLEKKGKAPGEAKLRPPVILPPVELKFDEGYWKAELTRVADTDTETLQTQKKTGLDKLAPPMKEEQTGNAGLATPKSVPARPKRDSEAEKALFEAEMDRLGDFDGFELRRAKAE